MIGFHGQSEQYFSGYKRAENVFPESSAHDANQVHTDTIIGDDCRCGLGLI